MNILKGQFYKVVIRVKDEVFLTYYAKITSVDEDFISFIDKYNKEQNYNKDSLFSYVLLTNKEIKENFPNEVIYDGRD